MYILLSVLLLLAAVVILFVNQPSFGRLPRGERLARVHSSANWDGKQFVNIEPTTMVVSDKSRTSMMIDFLFRKIKDLRPDHALPVIKNDLRSFALKDDVIVWLGHSSLFIQRSGKRILVDPVLITASPVRFFNKPFLLSEHYTPEDMPDVDYLIISHDHWDHLDYATVKRLKGRIGKVVCPLGVGEHFERWGFATEDIVEMDWNQSATPDEGITIHCLPSRHFSGRGTKANLTLWASYMLETSSGNIFLSGDGGYGSHFADIASRFGQIDVAVMENGQYNTTWRYIHLLPEDLVKAVTELQPRVLLTDHNSKYALAMHPWYEPLEDIASAALPDSVTLVTPKMGEPVMTRDITPTGAWWR